MRKYIFFLLVIILVSSCGKQKNSPKTGEIEKQTFVFSVKGTDTLRLDTYNIPTPGVKKPCVLFVFGGGFKGGARGESYNVDYLTRLAESGYMAIGMDYRLGMKDSESMQITDPADMVGLLVNSIYLAVEDLFDATSFVYQHADEWNIDKSKIIANGSSAGAVTVLQGEYMICNKAEPTQRLPKDFCYGGIIAFAGAIANTAGDLTWPISPAPIQLFHGDADRNVPFSNITVGDIGLYGSDYIAAQLHKLQSPYYYYKVENAAHEIAAEPMVNNLEEIKSFINDFVVNPSSLIINTVKQQIGKAEMEKEFGMADYLDANNF